MCGASAAGYAGVACQNAPVMPSGPRLPYDQALPSGAGDPGSARARALEEQRRIYMRRRAGALGGLLVFLAVLSAVFGGGGTHHKAIARVAAHPTITPTQAQAEQQAADSRAVQSVLASTPYVSAGQPRKREVALTFDDGPGPFTPQVTAVLRAHHVPATFFVVGSALRDFSGNLVDVLGGPNFVVGDHTQNHRFMSQLAPRDQKDELLLQADAVRAYQAPFPHLFRPPYGAFNASTLALLRRFGMLMVLWSVDTQDYRQPGVATIVSRALTGAKPGAIVLMHDAGGQRSQTVAALPAIIAGLHRRHLTPVTVPQLLADDPPDPNQPPPRPLSGVAG